MRRKVIKHAYKLEAMLHLQVLTNGATTLVTGSRPRFLTDFHPPLHFLSARGDACSV